MEITKRPCEFKSAFKSTGKGFFLSKTNQPIQNDLSEE